MKLSIIIAAYNEAGSILENLRRLEAVSLPGGFEKEIIIVDDGSTDGTAALLDTLGGKYLVIHHDRNRGKGSAIRTGLARATGNYVVTQDADLENDPNDLSRMLGEMIARDLTVLYGSRRLREENEPHAHRSFYLGGVFLSVLTNILYNQRITDEPTCYKMFRTDFLKSLPLRAERFEYCPEVTALTSLRGVEIPEIPISYHPRTVEQGKKIRWKDGIEAVWTLVSHRFKGTRRLFSPGVWIFLAALVARVALLLVDIHAAGGQITPVIQGQDGYFGIAQNIYAGHGFSWYAGLPSPFHVPLFPYFIAASLFLSSSAVPAALIQIVVGALIPLLALRLSLKLWPLSGGRKLALVVAWIIALEPNFIYFSFVFYTETMFIALFLVFMLVFAKYLETGKMKPLCISAIVLGVSALTKTSAQFMPVLLIPLAWLLLRKKLSARVLARNSLMFAGLFILALSPWLYRNYRTFGVVGMTIIPTYNLYLCVVPSVLAVADHTSFAAEYKKFIDDRHIDIGKELDFRTEKRFKDEAMAIILAHPGALVEVSAINVFTFFTHDGMLTILRNAGVAPTEILSRPALQYLLSSPIAFVREASGFILSPFVLILVLRLFWIAVTVAFFVGCYLLIRRKLVTPPIALALVMVFYFAATTPSNGLTVNARFRMPIDPIILTVAGIGVMLSGSFLKRRDISL